MCINKTAIVIVNIGTPEFHDYHAVKKYLWQFLTDKNVIEVADSILWKFLLLCFILPFRGRKLAKSYEKLWQVCDSSPLSFNTKRQSEELFKALDELYRHQEGADIVVDFAMRYGEPSISKVINSYIAIIRIR